jgi:multidrug efflux pump subunit AcrB
MIEWFTGNHVAANLLMFFLVVAGLMTAFSIRQEVFPQVDLDMVSVSVPYLGASPEEVEEGVCLRVEEAIQGIDGIKRINSTAVEGAGTVTAEITTDADAREVLDEIKQAVDRIITFPTETEKPIINLLESTEQAIDVVIYGDASERTLKELAEHVRDDLLTDPNITQAQLTGTRAYEISIEVAETDLRAYGLTFAEVTAAVRRGSLDLPGGSIKSEAGEILIRTKGQRYTGEEFAEIVVRTRPDGSRLTLGQLATIHDSFEDVDTRSRFDGSPAAVISVFRVADQAILDVTNTVKDYVEGMSASLPEGLEMAVWADRSDIYRSRMNLMLKNGGIGLVLVFLCLALFLQPRLAFWVALGIPISFLGGFLIIPGFGASLNMISMFAFIVVLGMVVDDAIVVGENIYTHRQMGKNRFRGAIDGTMEVAGPVIIAVTTTILAFFPLANVEGMMGKFMGQIPIVVIAVLLISLVESLLILPAHLSTIPMASITATGGRGLYALQSRFARAFEFFIERSYKPTLAYAAHHRAVVIAASVTCLLLLFGFVGGGHIRFTFMPKIDADNMLCVINMPAGTSVDDTRAVILQVEGALETLRNEVEDGRPDDAEPVFKHSYSTIGFQPRGGAASNRPGTTTASGFSGAHKAEVNVELLAGEERNIASNQLAKRWRELTGPIPGANSVSFSSNLFHGSAALQLQLSAENTDMLASAAERLKDSLSEYPGVQDIDDSYEEGKQELKLSLLPAARTLGLTLDDLARQVRQGFYGDEALRLQRGRDDVRVMVRYPRDQRRSLGDLDEMRVRAPNGAEVPFGQVAKVESGRGYASIIRQDRRRIVNVTADLDQEATNASEILADLQIATLPDLLAEFPGLRISFEGEERDRMESMASLKSGFLIAMLGIYALLAVLFRSYSQPLIIMSAIPFGILGAVLGHVIMGMDLTLLSLFGLVALTGVVVNDSLIMVDFINRTRKTGVSLTDAVLISGVRRFRPIVLTSLTTFAGLSPMLLEKSLQARFLIPMAISLGFGVLFATLITLVLVPVSYLVLEDVKVLAGGRRDDEIRDTAIEPAKSAE